MTVVKVKDMGRLLDDFDRQDINHAYLLAYLKNHGVAIKNQVPDTDRHWNFGPLAAPYPIEYENQNYLYPGIGYVIRSRDNALFCLSSRSYLANDYNIGAQVIGANLHELYLDMIVHMISQRHEQLPCKKIRIALPINHNNFHWTLLMADFENLNLPEYHALYNAYWQFANESRENFTASGESVSETVLKNNIKNFVLRTKEIYLTESQTVNENNREKRILTLPCWGLPVGADKITVRHYDSLGKDTNCAKRAIAAIQKFIDLHHAKTVYAKCASQRANTCGDWTQYNAFRFGVTRLPFTAPDSESLRFTYENLSPENAHQILFKHKRNLVECTPACAIHPFREVNNMEHRNFQDHQIQIGSERDQDNENADDIYQQFAEYPWLFNDSFPKAYWASKILFTLFSSYLTFTMLPSLFVASTFVYGTLAIANAALFFFNFDSLTQRIFGKKEIQFDFDKNNTLYVQDVHETPNLLGLLGVAPYRMSLETLEKQLELKLCVQEKQKHPDFSVAKCRKRANVLAHYYARSCVREYKDYFYDEAKEKTQQRDYVNTAKAKKYARA